MNTDKIAKEISKLVPVMVRHMYPFVFDPIDLSPSQVLALSTLYEKGDCSIGELSRAMHNTAPTMSGIVNRLERSGHIKRQRKGQDRRVVTIILTNKGIEVAKRFRMNIMRRWQFILSKLPAQEGENILNVLKKITKGFLDGSI